MLSIILSVAELDESGARLIEQIYYTYRNMLFTVINNIVENEADAEDILQNTFMKIAQNTDKIENTASPQTKSFLVIIAKSCTFDYLRRESRHKKALPFEELSNIGDLDSELESIAEKTHYSDICSCIKALPSPYVEVLYFHFVYGYTIKQTAKLLKRPLPTVKTQLVRGKKALIEKLQEVCYVD